MFIKNLGHSADTTSRSEQNLYSDGPPDKPARTLDFESEVAIAEGVPATAPAHFNTYTGDLRVATAPPSYAQDVGRSVISAHWHALAAARALPGTRLEFAEISCTRPGEYHQPRLLGSVPVWISRGEMLEDSWIAQLQVEKLAVLAGRQPNLQHLAPLAQFLYRMQWGMSKAVKTRRSIHYCRMECAVTCPGDLTFSRAVTCDAYAVGVSKGAVQARLYDQLFQRYGRDLLLAQAEEHSQVHEAFFASAYLDHLSAEGSLAGIEGTGDEPALPPPQGTKMGYTALGVDRARTDPSIPSPAAWVCLSWRDLAGVAYCLILCTRTPKARSRIRTFVQSASELYVWNDTECKRRQP